MKNYRITVNGVAYDVAVEELGAGEASAAPVSTPAAVPAPAKKAAPKTSGSAGAVKITAPMPGKILSVKASVGQAVKKGDPMLKLDLDYLRENAPSVASPVLCTELEDNQKIRLLNEAEIKAGDELFAIDIYEA